MIYLLKRTAAVFVISSYIVISLLMAIPVIILGSLAWLTPVKTWRYAVLKFLGHIPVIWTSFTNVLLKLPHHRWKIKSDAELNPNKWYVLISNHQSALDILALGYVFNRKSPPLKFFMKRELLWFFPLVGLGCWLLGYPFVHRHSRESVRRHPELKGKDIEITQKACEKFKIFPTTIVNFVEGTRFTPLKHQRQTSPYLHLLHPKAGGIAMVINALQNKLAGIINVTLHYSKPLSLWEYFCVNPREITVQYELLPLTEDLIGNYYEDRTFRLHFQKWLNTLWQEKDLLIEQFKKDNK
ncbi:acyltransferase [Coxiella burnetii]